MITLVVLPGLDGTGLMLADFAASFGTNIEVIVASYPADTALGYAELEPVARSFLPLDRPFFLLGESFSGPIAISIAASHPPGLQGLILCCSYARAPLPFSGLLRMLLPAVPVAALPVALLSHFTLGRFSSPKLRNLLTASLAKVSPLAFKTRANAALMVDASSLIPKINVPLLYLRASEDRLISKSASQEIVSQPHSAKIVEFTAPHFLLQVLPSQTASTVSEFMVSCLKS